MHEAPVVTNHDDPRSDSTVWVGIIGGLLLLLLIFGLQLVFHRWEGAEAQNKRGRAGDERLAALRAEQAGMLADYAWIDAEQGVLRMPIEAAMARIAADHAQGQARP
jgi:hypothetical protein